jgi:hypothetical protein
MFGADTLPAGVVPGGAVPKLKKSLLCNNVQPFMLVYGPGSKQFYSLHLFPAVPWQRFFYHSLSE